MKNIVEAMEWRYATSKFDTTKKLTDEQLGELLEVLRLTPSSFNLQPWKFVVVSNDEIKVKLREAGYGQAKISEASHLIVFAVEKNLDDAYVDAFVKTVSEMRGAPIESLQGYADMIKGALAGKTSEQKIEWATRQVYTALGVLVASAANAGIDVAPMEGFEPQKFDEILGLDNVGCTAKVIAAVGFRSADDEHATRAKVRFPKEEVVIEVK